MRLVTSFLEGRNFYLLSKLEFLKDPIYRYTYIRRTDYIPILEQNGIGMKTFC